MAVSSIETQRIAFLDGGQNGLPSPIISESGEAVQQIARVFPLQSYLDTTYEAVANTLVPPTNTQALLTAPTNEPIVPSTLKQEQSAGYAIAAAPWNQTPVAIKFYVGGMGGSSSTLIARPGEMVRPHGSPTTRQTQFNGFGWGLPMGWMGGGLATLFIFKSPDARVEWANEHSEVMFHRFGITVRAATGAPSAPQLANWPTRFPWGSAFRGATLNAQVKTVPQNGQPLLAISETTKVLLRLNTTGFTIDGTNNEMRVVFWGTDTFGSGADGVTVNPLDNFSVPIFWPLTAAPLGLYNPIIELDRAFAGVASNQYGITIDAAAGSSLIGAKVDVARYGRL